MFRDITFFDDVTTSVMAAFTSVEQQAYIKIESYRQKNAKQIHAILEQVCSDQALSYSQVARWVQDFRKGREAVKNVDQNSFRDILLTSLKCPNFSRAITPEKKGEFFF